YCGAASGIVANLLAEGPETRTTFTTDELRHFSRLITVGQLSTRFAQELMNPLTLIRGHLQVVEESLSTEESFRTNFEVVDRASRRIEEMAKRMLEFGKKRVRCTESWRVEEIISEALRFIQPCIRRPFVETQVEIDPQLPPVRVDRWQMVHALVNILQNAIEAMAESERRILKITACLEAKKLRITISDTGPGNRCDDVSKIFEPFFSTKTDRGAGLGLYVTKQVIEEHLGVINVRSSGCGTTFLIDLPISQPN